MRRAAGVLLALLVLTGGVRAEPWDTGVPSVEELVEAQRAASAARAALDSGDLAAASRELGGITLTDAQKEEWLQAVGDRVQALDPKLLAATLQERLRTLDEVEKLLAERRALATPGALPVPAEVTEPVMSRLVADRDRAKEQLAAAESTLATRKEQLAIVERQLEELPAEQERLRKQLDDWEPRESDPLDAYRRSTVRLRLLYATERLSFANRAKPVWTVLAEVRQVERDHAMAQLKVHEERVVAAREKYSHRADVMAEELEKRAKATLEAAGRPDLGAGEREALERESKVLSIRAATQRDIVLAGRIRKRRGEEALRNQSLAETREWLRERFEGEEGDRSVTARTVDLLLSTLADVRESLRKLDGELLPERERFLGAYLTARADVEDGLRELHADANADVEEPRGALRDRRRGLDDVKAALREMDQVYSERRELLDELYPFLVRKAYWVQSEEPLGASTVAGIKDEVLHLTKIYTGSELWKGVTGAWSGRGRFLLVGLGFVVLVGLGVFLIRKLRRYRTRWSYRGGRVLVLLQRLGASALLSALAPACLALAALLLDLLALPPEIEAPGVRLLAGAAGILFVRRFLWSLLRDGGVAREEMHAPPEVAQQLLDISRWLTAAFLFLWLPWSILGSAPLSLSHIPRVLYTAFLGAVVLLLISLARRRGPLVGALTARTGLGYRAWGFLGPLLSLGLVAIVGMDVLGYRVGSRMLMANVAETVVAVIVLSGGYVLVTGLVREASERLRASRRRDADAKEARERSGAMERQLTRLIGVAVVVAAVILLARFWGVASSLESLLSAIPIYGDSLSLWEVLAAIVWIVAGHFLVRHLPALFEVTVFSRMEKVTTGTRFVFLAVARYVVLVFAYLSAAFALHLSFSSLGYILAALSLGIGFGLQEIVSNFVAGLILLFERPIRVGDIITVGTTLGTVERINIRSTQVVNFDRQVIIIPNRKFITEDVTNWTHNDLVLRTGLEVGVRYGSDMEKVGRVLLEVVTAHPKVLKDPAPRVLFLTFGDSSLNLKVWFFTLIEDRLSALSELNGAVHARFMEEEIEIPFPQRDLHVRSVQDETLLGALERGTPVLPPGASKPVRKKRAKSEDPPPDPDPDPE